MNQRVCGDIKDGIEDRIIFSIVDENDFTDARQGEIFKSFSENSIGTKASAPSDNTNRIEDSFATVFAIGCRLTTVAINIDVVA